MILGHRLKQIRGSLSQERFAKSLGIHKNTLVRYEKGERLPDSRFLARVCKTYRVNPAWLLTGTGPMRLDSFRPASRCPYEEGTRCTHVSLGAAKLTEANRTPTLSESRESVLQFKREWLQQEFQADPEDLCLLYVDSRAMEPTLSPGDLVLVNKRDVRPVRDGLYLLRLQDSLTIKRLQPMPGGTIRVSSDNPAYEPIFIPKHPPAKDIHIVGRVVWAGRRL